MNALNKNDLARLKTLANAGDADAQFQVGKHYHLNGEAETANYEIAVQWYSKSAGQGDARAKTRLGIMYKAGLGVPADMGTAVQLWMDASKSGDPAAAFSLGIAYLEGNGVEKSEDEAIPLLQQAADKGLAAAQLRLGKVYRSRHDPRAITLLRAAAVQQNIDAQFHLGLALFDTNLGEPNFSEARHLLVTALFALEEQWDARQKTKKINKHSGAEKSDEVPGDIPREIRFRYESESIAKRIEEEAWGVAEKAAAGDFIALDTLYSAATTYCSILMELAEHRPDVIKGFAARKLFWPVLTSRGKGIAKAAEEITEKISLGEGLPYDLNKVAFSSSPAREWCFCLVNIVEAERHLLRSVADPQSSGAGFADPLRQRIAQLSDLTPLNAEEWFKVCWDVLLALTGDAPFRIPELYAFARNDKIRDAEKKSKRSQPGRMKAAIKQRLSQTFPTILKPEEFP